MFLGFRHTFLPHEHRFCGTGTRDKPLRTFAWEARVNDPYMKPHPLLCQGEGCSYTQVRVMHLPMLCRRGGGGGGRAWGGDLIVFVGPGVGHLTDLVLPGERILEYFFARRGDI